MVERDTQALVGIGEPLDRSAPGSQEVGRLLGKSHGGRGYALETWRLKASSDAATPAAKLAARVCGPDGERVL